MRLQGEIREKNNKIIELQRKMKQIQKVEDSQQIWKDNVNRLVGLGQMINTSKYKEFVDKGNNGDMRLKVQKVLECLEYDLKLIIDNLRAVWNDENDYQKVYKNVEKQIMIDQYEV